jgi:membrane-bound lytic murein transglycosylase D
MTLRVRFSILGTIALAGCFSHQAPAPVYRTVDVSRAKSAPQRDTVPRSEQAGRPLTPSTAAVAVPVVSPTEVARRALDVFGDSLVQDSARSAPAALRPTWDMDVQSYETQERVAHYVAMFTGRSRERIVDRLERGTRYEAMIRSKMREGGLPEDMYYLALIESGFDPNAYSRAAAVGMWQFMTSTARGMGLRVDWWVDERRDPVRSTAAAVRFIRGLRNQFGSLYLAAAAYNGGPGRVARGLARYADDLDDAPGDDAFFVLAGKDYLKNETREYVPQLIAAALVAKDPARYDMVLRPRPAFAYDSVRVPGGTPLAAVARAARSSGREIADLNTHLLRGMTPPRQTLHVRVPVGSASAFDSLFAAIPEGDRVAIRTVESRKGDTAGRLAREHGVSVSTLMGFNPEMRRLKSGRLAVGQRLLVPTAAVAALALSIPDPSVEKYPRSTARVKVHTVRRGETIGAIARRYSTTSERVMRINGMRRPVIFPGQTLLLSAPAGGERSARSASGSSRAVSTKKATPKRSASTAKKSRKSSSASKAKRSPAKTTAGARSKAGARSTARKR